jgi:hypothetical protein
MTYAQACLLLWRWLSGVAGTVCGWLIEGPAAVKYFAVCFWRGFGGMQTVRTLCALAYYRLRLALIVLRNRIAGRQ